MSSMDLENRNLEKLLPQDRLLFLLKMHGPQTAAELAKSLGITSEAARQQLMRLEGEGLLAGKPEVRGVGRPVQVYQLAALAQSRFPDAHAELTGQLINEIREVLGADALERLIEAREASSRHRYASLLAAEKSMSRKIARLAEIRTEEGYMAIWQKEGKGYLLIENHCPICIAATACAGFCRSEQLIFQEVLGRDVRIERIEHILAGARRCAYRITPLGERRRTLI
jgi:predicted ArsR family transcriptional regulator